MQTQSKFFSSWIATLSFASLLLSGVASATPPPAVKFGTPVYGGSGCPQGTAGVSITQDQSAFSVIFDQYSAEAGGSSGRISENKDCTMRIPIQVPAGYSASIFSTDYRTFANLPKGALGMLSSVTRVRGPGVFGSTLADTRVVVGPVQDDRAFSSKQTLRNIVRCGGSAELELWTRLRVVTNRYREDASMQVDSLDARSGATTSIVLIPCH